MRCKHALAILGVILTGALGLAPVVSAADVPTDADSAIRARVEEKLQSENLTNGSGPLVEVHSGLVTLTGLTKSLYAKNESVKAVLSVAGVQAVEDRLEIPRGESDKAVAEQVTKAVLRYPFFTIFDDVNLHIDEGKVTLVGEVTMPFKAKEIAVRVSKVEGVQSINNEITTLPVDSGDQRLRSVLAYRIYGDPLFEDYASLVNPPVHIVVEHGRVVLTGAVKSNVEKRKAEIIARNTFGVFSVTNQLQVAS